MIKSMFPKKTVAGVMSAFTKTIDDLKQVQNEHEAIAQAKHEAAAQALTEANAASREAIEARDMGYRLSNLLSMKPAELRAIESQSNTKAA